jgi:hypothetical protein
MLLCMGAPHSIKTKTEWVLCRAAKAVLAAEAAQQKALAAARLAFREAEATGQSLAASKAQDWLGAAEYAVEVS